MKRAVAVLVFLFTTTSAMLIGAMTFEKEDVRLAINMADNSLDLMVANIVRHPFQTGVLFTFPTLIFMMWLWGREKDGTIENLREENRGLRVTIGYLTRKIADLTAELNRVTRGKNRFTKEKTQGKVLPMQKTVTEKRVASM